MQVINMQHPPHMQCFITSNVAMPTYGCCPLGLSSVCGVFTINHHGPRPFSLSPSRITNLTHNLGTTNHDLIRLRSVPTSHANYPGMVSSRIRLSIPTKTVLYMDKLGSTANIRYLRRGNLKFTKL